ncbi:MAG: hypothetical protein GF347_01890, partial [Candidatus Moranbacteria bacterium]|nr:hypothetical protein [Candidatus Moranbacteria bacterium]
MKKFPPKLKRIKSKKYLLILILGALICSLLIFSLKTAKVFAEVTPGGEEDSFLTVDTVHATWEGFIASLGDVARGAAHTVLRLPISLFYIGSVVILVILREFLAAIQPALESLLSAEYYANDIGGFYKNEIVLFGYQQISYFANSLFIIVLLFIGVGTMLQIEKYNYKKLLVKLIIVAMLTNFSLLFAGIILDFFNILTFSLAPHKTNFDSIIDFTGRIIEASVNWDYVLDILTEDVEKAIKRGIDIVLAMILVLNIVIVLCAIAFFLIVRVVALWILLVLTPIGFATMAHPDTQSISQKWWGGFLKYALIGPTLMFFLSFALKMIDFIFPTMAAVGNDTAMFDDRSLWLKFFFLIAILWGSLMAASQAGIMGANIMLTGAKSLSIGSIALAGYLGKKIPVAATKAVTHGPRWLARKTGAYSEKKQIHPGLTKFSKGMDKTLESVNKLVNSFVSLGDVVTATRVGWQNFKKFRDQKDAEAMEEFSESWKAIVPGTKGTFWEHIDKAYYRETITEAQVSEIMKKMGNDPEFIVNRSLKSKDAKEQLAALRKAAEADFLPELMEAHKLPSDNSGVQRFIESYLAKDPAFHEKYRLQISGDIQAMAKKNKAYAFTDISGYNAAKDKYEYLDEQTRTANLQKRIQSSTAAQLMSTFNSRMLKKQATFDELIN